uniref:Uncharacterized protein n=1 Tax=Rhizophora mucronata TaxID=61149 RepID=A0A2P2N5R3_RHIMU
MFTNYSVS